MSRTAGWREAAPKRGKQRQEVLKRCGKDAFLEPHRLGYPVMGLDCRYDCRGIQSAYQRARQYHNEPTANAALALRKSVCFH